MFKELRENVSEELKENRKIISHQMKNINKDIEITFLNYQIDILNN